MGTPKAGVWGPVDGVRRGGGGTMTERIERTDVEAGGEASVQTERGGLDS